VGYSSYLTPGLWVKHPSDGSAQHWLSQQFPWRPAHAIPGAVGGSGGGGGSGAGVGGSGAGVGGSGGPWLSAGALHSPGERERTRGSQ